MSDRVDVEGGDPVVRVGTLEQHRRFARYSQEYGTLITADDWGFAVFFVLDPAGKRIEYVWGCCLRDSVLIIHDSPPEHDGDPFTKHTVIHPFRLVIKETGEEFASGHLKEAGT